MRARDIILALLYGLSAPINVKPEGTLGRCKAFNLFFIPTLGHSTVEFMISMDTV